MARETKNLVTIGLVQAKVSTDPRVNLTRSIRRIREAAKKGARIVCLQELFNTKYFPTDEKADVGHLAQPIPGEVTSALSTVASELDVVISAPIFEVKDKGLYFN